MNTHTASGMNETDERRNWHIDRRLTITHIIATVGMTVSLFLWGGNMDKRVEHNAQEISHLKELSEVQRAYLSEEVSQVKRAVQEINRKMDRLIEHRNSNGGG